MPSTFCRSVAQVEGLIGVVFGQPVITCTCMTFHTHDGRDVPQLQLLHG